MDDLKYTGHAIDLDFKDVDLLELFRLFTDISGLNVVPDPDVGGRTSLCVYEVPWDQALDMVLKRHGLGHTIIGNVIRIGNLDVMLAEAREARQLAAERALAGDTERKIVRLRHAVATEMMNVLASTALTARGYIVADLRSNSLIMTDLPWALAQMEHIISRLDVEPLVASEHMREYEAPSLASILVVEGDFLQQNIRGNNGTVVQTESFQGSAVGKMVGNRLRDSLNVVSQSEASTEVKEALRDLHKAVEELVLQLDTEDAGVEAANHLETLSRQAVERRPIREVVRVTGEGLLRAGTAVGRTAVLIEAVKKVAAAIGFPDLF